MATASKTTGGEFWVGVGFGVFAPVFIAMILTPIVLLRAWVLTWLWVWYVVPAFGLHPLRMVYAFGLALIVNFLTANPTKTDTDKKWWSDLLIAAGGPLFVLLCGWIGTFFI